MTLTPQLARQDDTRLILIDLAGGRQRMGGSIAAQCFMSLGETPPDVDAASTLKHFFAVMQDDAVRSRILAYHDRSDGGLFCAVAEMAFAARMGVELELPEGDLVASLFNEELGAVIQVQEADRDRVIEAFAASAIACHDIGRPRSVQVIAVRQSGQERFSASRATLQKRWSEVSWSIQRLRDDPDCADEEFAAIDDDDDPGLSVELSFDINEDVAAPYIATGVRPRIAILREQGVNSQVEMAAAFHRAGFTSVDIHMSEILEGGRTLSGFRGLVACGGFSYGDVLGAGEGWAKSILFHSKVRDMFQAFFEQPDTFGLGVCNGCQMMAALKELIPGAARWPRFIRNRSEQFEARFSLVQIQPNRSVLLHDMAGSHMPIAVSHGEGRAELSDETAAELIDSGLVTMRFVDNRGDFAERYPMNPNGTPLGITGVSNEDGRFTIMMPHPERVYRSMQNSWHPADWSEDSPWMRLFRNARRWVD